MRTKQLVAALRLQRAATVHRLAGLAPEQWDVVLRGGWAVRDAVAQLVTVDTGIIRGRYLLAALRPGSPEELNRWPVSRAQRIRDRSPQEHLDALVSSGARLAAFVGRVPGFVWQARMSGPRGRQPLRQLLHQHILREWAIEQQIAAAASMEDVPLTPVVAEALTAAVEGTLPGVILPGIERTTGVLRVVVDLGDGARRVFGMDFARKHYGRRITAPPTAVVRLDAATLALVSTRQTAWQDQLGRRISLQGDGTLAAAVLDALAAAP